MKKTFLFILILLFMTSCSEPKNDSEKVELVLKKSSQFSKKRNWKSLFQLYSKESSLKIELVMKSLFKVLLQTPLFSSDEIQKLHSKELYQEHEKIQDQTGENYFVKSFEILEKYPDYLNLFESNLKIYESYDILEIKILKYKAYILIKTSRNQKEAVFFIKEGENWKLLLMNDTERFA